MLPGVGKSYFERLSYRPLPGERKSGIPAEVDTPAPVRTIIFLPEKWDKIKVHSSPTPSKSWMKIENKT